MFLKQHLSNFPVSIVFLSYASSRLVPLCYYRATIKVYKMLSYRRETARCRVRYSFCQK